MAFTSRLHVLSALLVALCGGCSQSHGRPGSVDGFFEPPDGGEQRDAFGDSGAEELMDAGVDSAMPRPRCSSLVLQLGRANPRDPAIELTRAPGGFYIGWAGDDDYRLQRIDDNEVLRDVRWPLDPSGVTPQIFSERAGVDVVRAQEGSVLHERYDEELQLLWRETIATDTAHFGAVQVGALGSESTLAITLEGNSSEGRSASLLYGERQRPLPYIGGRQPGSNPRVLSFNGRDFLGGEDFGNVPTIWWHLRRFDGAGQSEQSFPEAGNLWNVRDYHRGGVRAARRAYARGQHAFTLPTGDRMQVLLEGAQLWDLPFSGIEAAISFDGQDYLLLIAGTRGNDRIPEAGVFLLHLSTEGELSAPLDQAWLIAAGVSPTSPAVEVNLDGEQGFAWVDGGQVLFRSLQQCP